MTPVVMPSAGIGLPIPHYASGVLLKFPVPLMWHFTDVRLAILQNIEEKILK